MKKSYILMPIVIILLLAILFITSDNGNHEITDIYTLHDSKTLTIGDVYKFSGEVIEIRKFYIPEIDLYNWTIDVNTSHVLYEVIFLSEYENGTKVFFDNDLPQDWSLGENVVFNQKVTMPHNLSSAFPMFESNALLYKMDNYRSQHILGKIPNPLSCSLYHISQDNFELAIDKISDFYPNKIKWEEICISYVEGDLRSISRLGSYNKVNYSVFYNNEPVEDVSTLFVNKNYSIRFSIPTLNEKITIRIDRVDNIKPFETFILYYKTYQP